MRQSQGNLLVQLGTIRASLVLEGESIHNLLARLFGLSRSSVKVVSKGRIRTEEEAMLEWRADPGQVFFAVGSRGTEEKQESLQAPPPKHRETLEKFKEWEREEKTRLATAAASLRNQPRPCQRLSVAMRRISQGLTRNSVAVGTSNVLQCAYLFFSTLWSPLRIEDEEVARARAVRAIEGRRRPMGELRRPENHATPMAGG